MEFDAPSLIMSLFVSGGGYVFFRYGRRMQRFPQMLVGLVMMVFPYFLSGALWMFLVACGLVGLLWLALRAGA